MSHPRDEVEHFLRIPRPEVEIREQFGRVAFAREDITIHVVRFGPRRLDREQREPHLTDEELQQAVLHEKEFARAMRVLAQTDHASGADDLTQRLEICESGAGGHTRDGKCGGSQPISRCRAER